MLEDPTIKAQTIQSLERPEHLLVWALRTFAVGKGDWPLLDKAFMAACGPCGGDALAAFFLIVRTISSAGRRRLRVHVPGCSCVSSDELAVVGIVAAAQASICDGNETLLRMRLGFLMEGGPSESLIFSAQRLAHMLEQRDHILPLRLHPAARHEFRPAFVQSLH